MDLAMNLFGANYLNAVDATWPGSPADVTLGMSEIPGLIGSKYKLSKGRALKLSNTTVGTLYSAVYQLVRTYASSTNALVVGGAVFWQDKENFIVTPDATTTSLFAGIAINIPTVKGNVVYIVVEGDVVCKCKATLTQAGAINDPVIISITSSAGTADVLADATGWTNVQLRLWIGYAIEALTNAGLKRVSIRPRFPQQISGIM